LNGAKRYPAATLRIYPGSIEANFGISVADKPRAITCTLNQKVLKLHSISAKNEFSAHFNILPALSLDVTYAFAISLFDLADQ
jgi:hypothetical protein